MSDFQLSSGWKKHPGIPGGWHLEFCDTYISVSIVTGPRGCGLMAHNDPGEPVLYEAWFSGMDNPMGYLTLDEIKGILKYLREKEAQDRMYADP